MIGGIFTSFILELVVYPAIYEVWEMAFGKAASCLILAGAVWAQAAQFHVRTSTCGAAARETMTVDENGVSFTGAKKHAWRWKY